MEETRQDSQINISQNNNSYILKYLIIAIAVLLALFFILFSADKDAGDLSVKQDASKKIYTEEEKLEILNSLHTGDLETGEIPSIEERREILNSLPSGDLETGEIPSIEERYRILNEM